MSETHSLTHSLPPLPSPTPLIHGATMVGGRQHILISCTRSRHRNARRDHAGPQKRHQGPPRPPRAAIIASESPACALSSNGPCGRHGPQKAKPKPNPTLCATKSTYKLEISFHLRWPSREVRGTGAHDPVGHPGEPPGQPRYLQGRLTEREHREPRPPRTHDKRQAGRAAAGSGGRASGANASGVAIT